MPHIQPLPSHLADLIAAGEVVERPASVVKELMENAMDAGATAVTVEIQHGGMTLVRVTDNGCGIAPQEATVAFLRHATSKIREERDLEAIGTLGFRGEALAAIAAVSRTEMLTRTAERSLGVALTLEGGVLLGQEQAGCPVGTTLLVRDLFFNTPARLKFVRKDAAEGAAVFAVVQHLALSHPQVAVTFLRDGKQELLTPGDGQLKSAIYSVFGRDLALGFTPISGSGEDMSVTGFVSLPACCRGTRGYQHFFVNGRYVKSRTMLAALEEAYKNQKMVGKFPGCVLHLTMKLSGVDVNVHPTKTEVKFSSDRRVFDAVYYGVKSALEGDTVRVSVLPEALPLQPELPRVGAALHDFTHPQGALPSLPSLPSLPKRPGSAAHLAVAPAAPAHPAASPAAPAHPAASPAAPAHPAASPAVPATPVVPATPAPATPAQSGVAQAQPAPGGTQPSGARPGDSAPPPQEPWRIVGELFHTYIIVEQGESALFIDKHAAHERMQFDKLKAAGYTPMVQSLLSPVVVTPSPEESAALLAELPLLQAFGFEAEDFGDGAIIVRGVPFDVHPGEVEGILTATAQRLLLTGRADPAGARDELLHTMACKAAIKGGQKNSPAELQRVAQAVMSGAVQYCPHGRPVVTQLTRAQLEKRFKRS